MSPKEEILSTKGLKSGLMKTSDGQCPLQMDKERRYANLKFRPKQSKNSDNRLIQHQVKARESVEETEIKRCYGGEENEEKTDVSKDEVLDTSFMLSLTKQDLKEGGKPLLPSTHSAVKSIPTKEKSNLLPVLDNKVFETLGEKHLCGTDVFTSEELPFSQDKEACYYNLGLTGDFLGVSNINSGFSKNQGHQLNNLGECTADSFQPRDDFQNTGQKVVDLCMAVNRIDESNYFDQYSRDSTQTFNIQPFDKNLQKQISNIYISLKDEISPLAAQEGVDEKCLHNTLTNLWNKLYSKLTPHQFKKVMVAIEMNQGGKRLPVLLGCSNLLSAGGDLDWQEISGRLPMKEKDSSGRREDFFRKKEDVMNKDEEKRDLAEITEELKSRSDINTDAGLQTEGTAMTKEKVEADENKEENDSEVVKNQVVELESNDTKLQDPCVDKALDEGREENISKNDGDTNQETESMPDVEKQATKQGSISSRDKEHASRCHAKTPSMCRKEMGHVHKNTTVTGPFKVRCKNHKQIIRQNWEADLDMLDEVSAENWPKTSKLNLGHLWKVKGKKKNQRVVQYRDGNGCLIGSVDEPLLVGFRRERIDVRVKYFQTKSCMHSAGSGGGNSSCDSSSSNGSSSNKNSGGNDRKRSEDEGSSNSQNNNGRDNYPPSPNDSLSLPRNQMVDKKIPGQDYKAVRKKHALMSDEQLIDLLGSLSPDTSPSIQEDPGLLDDVNQCLLILLHSLPNQSDPNCSVCSVLHSLLSHFATCQQVFKKCNICWQLLRLGLYHVQKCLNSGKDAKESPSDVCYQLIRAADYKVETVQTNSERLWIKMKKYVVSVFHPPGLHGGGSLAMSSLMENEESNFSGLTTSSIGSADQSLGPSLTSAGTSQITGAPYQTGYVGASSVNGTFMRSGSGRNFQPSLTSIPENPFTGRNRMSGRNRSKRRLSRQSSNESTGGLKLSVDLTGDKSDDGSLPESGKQVKGSDGQGSIGELLPEGFVSLPNVPTQPSSTKSSLGTPEDASLTTSLSSASGQNEEGSGQSAEEVIYQRYKPMIDNSGNIFQSDIRAGRAGYSQDPYETQKTYGQGGVMSLPIRPNIPLEREQLFSLETAPTGEPGIGEVVYGTRRQIMKVAQYWARIRGKMDSEGYKHQLREEGVILDSAKKYLRILRTRYQKKNQWMRLVHLGNGVAGKCHLAQDKTSDFKFCVKRVHIAKYEENELVTWSDLDHTNIVRLYGAIRHGCKIYIFCEFIAGGSLTSLINEQRSLNRRLSHWMCLRYFKQLLQVLVYLKSKNVLHEDLKADNILIKRNTTLIAVTDFGLARRMNVDSEMKGMSPTGSQTQWSPEKATSNGHGFAADVWAAVCILVHILSGYPPWSKRYPSLQMLHFVIFTQSPPLVDVPQNIQEVLRDLITLGFTVDPTLRPTAADLLKHPAFKILDQGAPESYYSTLLTSGQVIPNNMLDTSDKGPKEMEEILNNLSVTNQDEPPTSSVQVHEEKTGAGSSLPENNPESGSLPERGNMLQAVAGEASGSSQMSIGHTVIRAAPEDAAGAVGGRSQSGTELEEKHFSNLPAILNTSLGSGPDAAEGSSESCSGYATSPDSFEDPEEYVYRFLSDDVPMLDFTMVPQQLRLYQPREKDSAKETRIETKSDLPRWSLLLGDQSFSGIEFVEEIASEEINKPSRNQMAIDEVCGANLQEGGPSAPTSRILRNPQSTKHSSRESSVEGHHCSRESSVGAHSSSNTESHNSSGQGSPAPTRDQGYISPSDMKPLQLTLHQAERQSPVVKPVQEDQLPTSYYPPDNFFDENFDSGDLFGDPSDPAMTSMLPTGHSSILVDRQPPPKELENSHCQVSSIETHLSSGILKSGSSAGSRNVYFEDQHTEVQITSMSPPSDYHTLTKPRSSSAPNISIFNRGTADYAIETGKNMKDCPLESTSMDLPNDIAIGGESIVNEGQDAERPMDKKKPGLTLDVSLVSPKKHHYKRNQSTPAVPTAREAADLQEPKTCPGQLQTMKSMSMVKKADDSSGLGTSVSGEERRQHSIQSSGTSGVWTPDNKGRHSSAEMSPKSQFDHQEREFCALEKASKSDISAHDHEEMMANADLEIESGVTFGLGPEHDSFEDQLSSVRKTIPDIPDEHKDLGHKYQLLRDDNTPLSPIRVPARYEEWRDVIDLIRSVVIKQGIEHFTLKHSDDVPVDYNAPLSQSDMKIKVCVVEEEQIDGDSEGSLSCWCERHEDQLRAMA